LSHLISEKLCRGKLQIFVLECNIIFAVLDHLKNRLGVVDEGKSDTYFLRARYRTLQCC
jgi:hypothetical protein